LLIAALAAMYQVSACGQTPANPAPVLLDLGPLRLRPAGFFEPIGLTRSQTSTDSVSTKFGSIPLTDSPAESLGSIRHSRLTLKADLPAGEWNYTVYLESDFMNFTSGQSPWRWRQYWGQVRWGKWELLGGRAWSLLRPNRVGIASDRDVMNTDVIEPAYEVGLAGSRNRQVRLARDFGEYKAVVAWEGEGNLLTKVVRDHQRTHLEAGGLAGKAGRRSLTASAVVGIAPRLRIVTQQYWSKRAANYALSIVPAGANGFSSIEGVEAQITRRWELYGYGGFIYGSRVATGANRVVWEWSGGANYRVPLPYLRAALMASLQLAQYDRSVWDGRHGELVYLMYRLRYTFN
jgi:hypothetical protein